MHLEEGLRLEDLNASGEEPSRKLTSILKTSAWQCEFLRYQDTFNWTGDEVLQVSATTDHRKTTFHSFGFLFAVLLGARLTFDGATLCSLLLVFVVS